MHLLLDHDGHLPCFANMTAGSCYELHVARSLKLPAGSILVIDRGYFDYTFFDALSEQGVFFVTRLKGKSFFRVITQFPACAKNNILSDELIDLGVPTSSHPQRILRRITFWDETKQCKFEFLTNNTKLAASTIAAIYKERWHIELFFKAIKQNLKIKTFLGTTPNAVRIQIWTALIAILLLKYLKMRSSIAWSLSNLIALLRFNLFVHRPLWDWINQPMKPPPITLSYFQTTLSLC